MGLCEMGLPRLASRTARVSRSKIDINPNTRRVAVRLLVDGMPQTLYWASTENYEHKCKGRGPVGDVELVDEAGRVYGVFLNEWCVWEQRHGGGGTAKCV